MNILNYPDDVIPNTNLEDDLCIILVQPHLWAYPTILLNHSFVQLTTDMILDQLQKDSKNINIHTASIKSFNLIALRNVNTHRLPMEHKIETFLIYTQAHETVYNFNNYVVQPICMQCNAHKEILCSDNQAAKGCAFTLFCLNKILSFICVSRRLDRDMHIAHITLNIHISKCGKF